MDQTSKNAYLRKLPSVDEVMRSLQNDRLLAGIARTTVVRAVQELVRQRREQLLAADDASCLPDTLYTISSIEVAEKSAALRQSSLRRVINASGIIVHTNLGRAPLCEAALQQVVHVAHYYSNLEFDLAAGERGSRSGHIEWLLQELTGAEAGFVVNNNAAAVLLCLASLARGRDVIVSRGELIEIGGSFRIPEVMAESGARLVEIGTTNRTHPSDYRNAANAETALFFKAHTSNYRIVGFTAEVSLAELTQLGRELAVPVLYDMGSGAVIDPSRAGLRNEPTVQEAVKMGVDIITFSGDKLLGGPQAGIIAGRRTYIEKIKKHPLARALRIDKLTLAALDATLRTYVLAPEEIDSIPVVRMLMAPVDVLKEKAQAVADSLRGVMPDGAVTVVPDVSQIGGGAYPLQDLPTWVVSINPSPWTPRRCEELLRACSPPVVCRISKDRVILDMRTLLPDEDSLLVACLRTMFSSATKV